MSAEDAVRCDHCGRPIPAPERRRPSVPLHCDRCAGVGLRLRPDLLVQPVEENGTRYFVIKDPVDGRYFRIKDLEHYFITQFDGETSFEEMRRRASEERRVLVGTEVLERFADKFARLGLLDGVALGHGVPARKRDVGGGRVFFLKLPLANPERLLDRLYPALGWLFRPGVVTLMTATILLAMGVALANREGLRFGLSAVANAEGLLLIYLTVTAVTVLHELAHGVTCRHFGGRVQDMGFLLMYFVPCFYCNVSDTYLFKEKRKRLWVLFSGGFFELFIWAIAVLGWRLVAPETFISRLFFVVIGVSGVKTLFNFNPLIKLDGYYLLSDFLGIANLRREALSGLGRFLRRRALGLDVAGLRPELASRRVLSMPAERFLTVFGAAALLYTLALVSYLVVFSGEWIYTHFGSNGLGFFALGLVGLLHKPASSAATTAREVSKEKWEQLGKEKRRRRTVFLWVVVVLGIIFLPWQLRIASDLRVMPQSQVTVRAPADGRIAHIHFREGERVEKGALLAEYDTKALELEKKTQEAELARATEELRLLGKPNPTWQEEIRVQERALETARTRELQARERFDRNQQLWDVGLLPREQLDESKRNLEASTGERRRQEAQMELVRKASPESRFEQMEMFHLRDPEAQRAVIQRLQAEIDRLEDLLTRSRIFAPISGTLTTYRFQEKVGEFLEEGDPVCEIVDDDRVVIEMQVPEKQIDAIELGYPVKFKVLGYPHRAFYAEVAEIAPVASAAETMSTILVRAWVENPDHLLKPGMTGLAKIYCGWTVMAHILTRDLFRFIRTEFWL